MKKVVQLSLVLPTLQCRLGILSRRDLTRVQMVVWWSAREDFLRQQEPVERVWETLQLRLWLSAAGAARLCSLQASQVETDYLQNTEYSRWSGWRMYGNFWIFTLD